MINQSLNDYLNYLRTIKRYSSATLAGYQHDIQGFRGHFRPGRVFSGLAHAGHAGYARGQL